MGQTLNTRYCSGFSNYGDRVDIIAPGEKILSTVSRYIEDMNKLYNDHKYSVFNYDDSGYFYTYMDGTSQATPQVSGVAGMIYSLCPSIKAEQVKKIIINNYSGTITPESNIDNTTYKILDAEAAVKAAIQDPSFGGSFEESDDGLLIGSIKDVKNKEFKNATINVYEYDEANANIPVSEGKINGTIGDFVCSTTSDEYGEYVLRLKSNEAYYVTYTADNYQKEQAIIYINNKNVDFAQDVVMKRLNVANVDIKKPTGEKVSNASVDVTVTDNLIEGEYTTKDEDGSYVYTLTSNDTESVSGSFNLLLLYY